MRRDLIIGAAGLAGAAAVATLYAHLLPLHEDLAPEDVRCAEARCLSISQRLVAFTQRGGSRDAVLLLHGFGSTQATWRHVLAALSPRTRVVSVDLWGFGASERLPGLTTADWTTQILTLMDQLQISSAVLVGHSIGGRVALSCAAADPARVRGVALVASDGAQYLSRYPLLWAMARTPLLKLMLHRLKQSPAAVVELLRSTYAPNYPISQQMVRDYQRPIRVRGTFRAWSHLGRSYPNGDLERVLPQVRCPVTLVWGTADRVTPVRAAFEMMRALPVRETLLLPGVGHLPQEESPARVADHLLRFIDGL